MDFETINDVIGKIDGNSPSTETANYLFLIGMCWRINPGNKLYYKHFTTPTVDFNSNAELENLEMFHIFLNELLTKYDAHNDFVIYHWSNAERSIYNTMRRRYPQLSNYANELNWCDLLKVFKDESIVINGSFNFGLKSIAKALYRLGYINTLWEENEISNGLSAMIQAMECSKRAKACGMPMFDLPIMKQIINYNEVDCKMVFEILQFLRHYVCEKKSKRKSNNESIGKKKRKV